MALKTFFLSLTLIVLCVVWLSLAQQEWIWFLSDSIYSGQNIETVVWSNIWENMTDTTTMTIYSGQTMTGLDSDKVGALWLEILGVDSLLLSGNSGTILGSWNGTGDINSWDIVLWTWQIISDSIPRLILSEVYYDGTDERIEITNIGDGNFQGNFTLMWAKSTPVTLTNITLLSGESKLFGDSIGQVSGTQYIGKTGLALNLTDTSPINIQLIVSGQIVDSFLVDEYRVNAYNDKKTSFEKVGLVPTWVQSDRVAYAQSGYTINPGVYFRTGTVVDVSFPPTQSWDNLQLPVSCVSLDQRDLIKINEIFPWNEKYPPYIELAIHADITLAGLSVSGNRLATGVEFVLDTSGTALQKNTFLLLSSTGFRKNEGMQSVRNSGFSLVSTWNRLVITIGSWQNRQVLDIAYVSGEYLGKSSYFATRTYQCARIFDYLDDFSPGFEQKFLKYFSGTTITKIEYIQVTTGYQSATGTCPLSWPPDVFSWETWATTTISSTPDQYTIQILHVDYDPPGPDTNNEKITLLATNISGDQTPLDLSKTFRLKVNGTNKTLPWILPINVPTTFIKTFGFPNSTDNWQDVIIQLIYGDYVFDTYTYNPNTPKQEKTFTGDIQSTGTVPNISGMHFTITYVLPNPLWSDTFEELWLKIMNYENSGRNFLTPEWGTNSGELDLSQGFTLRIGKSKKKITGKVIVGQENILSWSLGLINKSACISLFYQEQELTKFCYRTPKEGEKIYASDTWLVETSQENLDILNAVQLKTIANKLCIRYKEESFLCKHIPASKAEIKTTQEQKLYKWFASVIKQYLIDNWKGLYDETPLKEYFDLVAQNKKLIGQWIAQVDIYGQSLPITDVKQQIYVLQTTLPWIIGVFAGENTLQ